MGILDSKLQDMYSQGKDAAAMYGSPMPAAVAPATPMVQQPEGPRAQSPVTVRTQAAPVRTPSAIAERVANRIVAAQGIQTADPNGYAVVGGKQVNYADIGTRNDALRGGAVSPASGTGGWAMSSGGAVPADPNVGLAVSDAQRRQYAMDASGVGAGGTAPRSLESRLRGIQGTGEGALMEAVVQSKIARGESKQANLDRNYDLAVEDSRAKNAYNAAVVQRDLANIPLAQEEKRSAIELNRAKAKKADWETSPAGIAAKRKSESKLPPEQESHLKQIAELDKEFRKAQADTLKQEGIDTRVDVPGGTLRSAVGPAYYAKREHQNQLRRELDAMKMDYNAKYGGGSSKGGPLDTKDPRIAAAKAAGYSDEEISAYLSRGK